MLFHLLFPLNNYISGFNVFRYITFRTIVAAMTAFLTVLMIGPHIIKIIRKKTNQVLRKLTPDGHKKKAGTPSMGGIIIILSVATALLVSGNFSNPNTNITLFIAIGFSFLGFIDDYIKDFRKDGKGISARVKFYSQIIMACIVGFYLYFQNPNTYHLASQAEKILKVSEMTIPFLYNFTIDFGIFYIPLTVLIIVGCSNAVNITDGLDGLAIGLSLVAFAAFTVIAYLSGHTVISEYLKIPFSPQLGEVAVFGGAFAGAALGFLWFNSHPAQIFMGDTGALAIGGTIGTMAVLLKKELLLIIIGGVFVIETLSVMIQILSWKIRKKRVFKMAPLHHHFELTGMKESKIINRFWILGILFALLALATFKIR